MKLSINVFAGAALWLAVLPQPAVAQEADLSKLADDALLEQLGGDRWMNEPCDFGRALVAEISRREISPPDMADAATQIAKLLCATQQGEYRRAMDALQALERRQPMPAFDAMAFALYEELDEADAALLRFTNLMTDTSGAGLTALPPESVWAFSRTMSSTGRSDEFDLLALEIYEGGLFERLDPVLHSSLATRALNRAARDDRPEIALDLLDHIRLPNDYAVMLADRELASLWPQIEARAGENLANVSGAYVDWTAAQLEADPTDRDLFGDAVRALYMDGRFEEAVALSRTTIDHRDDGIAEGEAWAMNIEGYSLDTLGREEEADAVFDRLASYDPKENLWVVNFVINRAIRLARLGRWDEALEANALAREIATTEGTTYARMLVAGTQLCTLSALDRGEDAAVELEFLRENAAEHPGVAADALLCAGLEDESAGLVAEVLADDDRYEKITDAYQPQTFGFFHLPGLLPRVHDLLDTHPELVSAFEKRVRQIPERFTPRLAIRRADLAGSRAR
ncbi:hypothetical protein [Aurantiacibacter hainanensis]|uniref:hypothetical protein n=1 Tax=Aurantiacibacter hainanensis TaxID=3076114 RepID=UPI0030C6FF11